MWSWQTFQEQKEYLKAKIEDRETDIKIKNIRELYRDVGDITKVYQPRTNIVKDEKVDLFCGLPQYIG